MSDSESSPAAASSPRVPPSQQAFSMRAARFVRRAMLPAALLGGLLLWWCYGILRVPQGMDSTPDAPPGALCILDKRSGSAQPGRLVFIDLPSGGTLLSRVTARDDAGNLTLHNDHAGSLLPDSRSFGPVSVARLRGTVLSVFLPDTSADLPRGK